VKGISFVWQFVKGRAPSSDEDDAREARRRQPQRLLLPELTFALGEYARGIASYVSLPP
jgi:hypothetical protein